MGDRKLTALLKDKEISVEPVQGNTVKRVSAALQPNTLLILITSNHIVGQPAVGRERGHYPCQLGHQYYYRQLFQQPPLSKAEIS